MRPWRTTIRAAAHRVSWWLATASPVRAPLVLVVGYPKSGTTWAGQLLGDCLDVPYPRRPMKPLWGPAILHGHRLPVDGVSRGVYMLRDGRDAMVSLYFYLARQLPEGDDPRLNAAHRKLFPVMHNKDDIRANLPAFLQRQLQTPFAAPVHWGEHVDAYFELAAPSWQLLRFESLIDGDVAHLERVAGHLRGAAVEHDIVIRALKNWSFEAQAGRPRGTEERTEFLRRGTPGEWREYFNREAAEIFQHYCGPALQRAGYAPDGGWVEHCAR